MRGISASMRPTENLAMWKTKDIKNPLWIVYLPQREPFKMWYLLLLLKRGTQAIVMTCKMMCLKSLPLELRLELHALISRYYDNHATIINGVI